MSENTSVPRRTGLLELLRVSVGSQFVIPVYQRNYTWNAEREVKQYLTDLTQVLIGNYKNHFLGILIYLEKSIDFGTRELSIIDGQQRLTTTFLILFAVKEMFLEEEDKTSADQLDYQYLTNPFHKEIKYKLKPLVADDSVYKCIAEGKYEKMENYDSTVFKNYNYIKAYLNGLRGKGYTLNDILLALDKLYLVSVPILEGDNAQKIFESINATGVKLTGADLIRNFLLMNLTSEIQDKYYADYWKTIEENVSADSKELEMFFRMYLAIKTYVLVPKNGVYRSFVDYVESEKVPTEALFQSLLGYARLYNTVSKEKLDSLAKELRDPLMDYRKINSEIPLCLVLEFFKLYHDSIINASVLGQTIETINAFMIRRSICDLDSQNISRLFPTTLKKVLETCSGDYSNLVAIFNQELVGNNADTSGSYMPTDEQMHDYLINANVYKRTALRIILDRLELRNNPAPVDLSHLSIEHLMPQTPTEKWLEELETDEGTYMFNLHRLGNLTLAAKPDNSKMGNSLWDYKNAVLESTAHLKLNMELIPIEKWTIDQIEKRTNRLIKDICDAFPYPEVSVVAKSAEEMIDESIARSKTVKKMLSNEVVVKKNYTYKSADNGKGYVLLASKLFMEGNNEKYWFAYREKQFDKISDCPEQHFILICRNKKALVLDVPRSFIDSIKGHFNVSTKNDAIVHYHIVIHKDNNGKTTILLSKPTLRRIDVSQFVVAEL